jgi:hypothetical protein
MTGRRTPLMLGLAALNCIMGFYLACFFYRVVTQATMYFFLLAGAILSYFKVTTPGVGLMVVASGMSNMRDNTVVMIAVAAGIILLAARIALKRPQRTTRRSLVTSSILTAVVVTTLVADWTYGVTPLDDVLPISEIHRRSHPLSTEPAVKLTVTDIMALDHKLSGAFAEVEGILDYSPAMRRFMLRDPEGNARSIAVYFQRGAARSFDQSLDPDRPPRYFDRLKPFVGHPVKVYGKCLNGAVYVDLSDIALFDSTPALAPAPAEGAALIAPPSPARRP